MLSYFEVAQHFPRDLIFLHFHCCSCVHWYWCFQFPHIHKLLIVSSVVLSKTPSLSVYFFANFTWSHALTAAPLLSHCKAVPCVADWHLLVLTGNAMCFNTLLHYSPYEANIIEVWFMCLYMWYVCCVPDANWHTIALCWAWYVVEGHIVLVWAYCHGNELYLAVTILLVVFLWCLNLAVHVVV